MHGVSWASWGYGARCTYGRELWNKAMRHDAWLMARLPRPRPLWWVGVGKVGPAFGLKGNRPPKVFGHVRPPKLLTGSWGYFLAGASRSRSH